MVNLNCRLCAQLKTSDSLLHLDYDEDKFNEIVLKLTFLNAIYVDISSSEIPKTICLDCYSSLNSAYEFLNRVRKAQDVLSSSFSKFKKSPPDSLDFGRSDDFFDGKDVKNQDFLVETKHEPLLTSVNVKIEPEDDKVVTKELETESDAPDSFRPVYANMQVFLPRKIKCWKEYPWTCSYCNIEFTDLSKLRSHSKIVHSKCAGFACIDCPNKSYEFNLFIVHVKMHQKNLRNLCHLCDAIVAPKDLKSHVKKHLQSQHCCEACGDTFQEKIALQQHELKWKPKKKRRKNTGKPSEKDLTCHICNKVYKRASGLKVHLKRHQDERMRNYTCDRCGKTFYSKGTLTKHVMSHDEVRPHVCNICNKSFMFPNKLRRHVDMHLGVKPFSCEVCGRCFRLKYQLNAHMIMHTDSLPHVCQYCKKAFRFKQVLKSHERQHTGAKPYSCVQCFMEFSNWSNYNKHMKRRHNIDTSKKKITPRKETLPSNSEIVNSELS